MREVMLSERIAPLAIGSGLSFIMLALIACLFATNFPSTGRVKELAGYRVLAGAYLVVGAALALLFCVCFAIIVADLG